MWPGIETDVDLPGFQVHSGLVRSVGTDESLLRVTVGVFSDWRRDHVVAVILDRRSSAPASYFDL